MAFKRPNAVQQYATGSGLGDLTLGSAVDASVRTLATAGMVDGDTARLRIQHMTILAEWEIVTVQLTGGTISRTFDDRSESSTGALISFSDGTKVVSSVVTAGDIDDLDERVSDLEGHTLANRIKLTGPTDFFVDNLGDDGNSGASGHPKKSIQAMWDTLQADYDCAGFLPMIHVADSEDDYEDACVLLGNLVGGLSPCCSIVGNEAHPENVTINPVSSAFIIGANVQLAGMKLKSTNGSLIIGQDSSVTRHQNMWFADCGQEMFATHFGPSIVATGPTRISGSCRSWVHTTEGGQVNFDDQALILDEVDPPRCVDYILGVNRADVGLERTTITGSFVADEDHSSRWGIHFKALVNVVSATGLKGFFPAGQSPMVVEKGGKIVYDAFVEDVIYWRPDANGDGADGYEDCVERAFKTPDGALAYLARREPDTGFDPIPTLQAPIGYTYAVGYKLIDIPGVAVARLRGDPDNPSNCKIITTGAKCVETLGTQTTWIVEGFEMSSVPGVAISVLPGNKIKYGNNKFGPCTVAHVSVNYGSYVEDIAPNEITGGAGNHIQISGGEARLTEDTTLTGTPSFTAFASLGEGAKARLTSSYTGSATGKRFDITGGSSLTRGADTLPGDAAGTIDSTSYTDMVLQYGRERDLYVSAATFGLTGTTSKTLLVNVPIPINGLGANGYLDVFVTWGYTNNSNLKSVFIEAGGVNYFAKTYTTGTGFVSHARIRARQATNVQRGGAEVIDALISSSFDNTTTQNISISGQLAVGTDALVAQTIDVRINPRP